MKLINIINESPEREVGEGGYSRVMSSMRGLIPKIKTIGIFTAENPCARELPPEENKIRNGKLEKIIAGALFGYKKVKGSYGSKENSFMVNNITKKLLLQLGEQFDQESVIFGEYFEEGEKYGMVFRMIRSSSCGGDEPVGTIMGERKVFINRNNEDDYYTEVKGRKFQIPFFEVPTFDDDKGTKTGEKNKHMYDTHYDNAEWGKGDVKGAVRVYPNEPDVTDKLSDEDKKEIEKLNEESVDESKTLSSHYNRRGRIKNILNKYM